MDQGPLSPAELHAIDAYWRAANYLSVGQIYLRDNPRGRFDEYAHHSGGCRAWLVVSRNTETHEVYGAVTARDYAKAKGDRA